MEEKIVHHRTFLADELALDAVTHYVEKKEDWLDASLDIFDGLDVVSFCFMENVSEQDAYQKFRNKIANLHNCIGVFLENLQTVIEGEDK